MSAEVAARRWGNKRKSAAAYEDEQDTAMKGNAVALERRSALHDAFRGDPHADPRPAPLGLYDTASGWNYFSRGGEKVFGNSKGLAHPLLDRPKYMKARYNVNRGWNPKVNSSFAHRVPLKKYRRGGAV